MKTLSPLQQTLRADRSIDVVWLARFRAPDGPIGIASRRVTIDGTPWPPLLLRVRSLALSSRIWIHLPVGGEERTTLEIARPDETHPLYSSLVMDFLGSLPDKAALEIGVVFLPPDPNTALGEGDATWLFHGRIETISRAGLTIQIEGRGELEKTGISVPRSVRPEALARCGLDPRSEIFPPLVYGRVPGCSLLPWWISLHGRLAQRCEYNDTVLYMDSVDGWPPAGRVQIADEVIEYRAVDAVNATLGTESTPLERTEPRSHPVGASARLIPPNGPVWLVAGHPCFRVDDVRAGGLPFNPGLDYEVIAETLDASGGVGLPPVTATLLRADRIPWTLDYDSGPVRRSLDPNEAELSIHSLSNALEPAAAIDGDSATAARLTAAAPNLFICANLDLARQATGETRLGDRRFGRYQSIALEIVLGADRLWNPASKIIVTLRWKSYHATQYLLRPADEEALARFVSSTSGEDETTGDTSLPPRTYTLDLTGIVKVLGGWAIFNPPDNVPRFDLEFRAVDDPAVLRIYDFRIRLGYYPASRCEMRPDLTATVEGRMDGRGELIESPVGILRDLLTAPDTGGVAEDDLSADDWTEAEAAMAERDARMRRRIARPLSLDRLVESVAGEAGLSLIREAEGWRIRTIPRAPLAERTVAVLDDSSIVRVEPLSCIPYSEIVNEVEVIGPGSGAGVGNVRLARVEAEYSIAREWGRRGARIVTQWWNSDGSADAQAVRLAETVAARGARAGDRVAIEFPLTRLDLERGDVVSLASAALRVAGRVGEIESIRLGERGATLVFGIRLTPGASVVWASPDGSARVESADDATGLTFIVAGRTVALLTSDGRLRIARSVLMTSLVPIATGELLSWDGDASAIRFAAGPEGDLRVVAALDANGDLQLAGEIAEGGNPGAMESAESIALQGTDLVLSADRRSVHGRLTAAGTLVIGKEVVEGGL